MIDPILTLAFSMQSAPGLYALLVASGISRAAKIPTGWEITVDLIRRVAMLEKADCEPDPAAWHLSRFGHEANYSELLQELAKTSAERSQLLRRYFEPTDEERQRGEKVPTAGHHAIAELVAGGYVKVIISPNFDRLMEQALQAKGIEPTVVSSAAQAEGLGALSQIRCLVLKPHGDYLETGLKNTPDELRSFDPAMNVLLDRIFDDFGLIVSGWSAEYDHALVEAIERSKSRRYSMFWTTLGEPADRAKRLIAFRHATTLRILSADAFFRAVADNVVALEKYGTTHPLSISAAVARLKEYLALPGQNRISIHELITEAGNQLCSVLAQYREPRNAHADGYRPP